MLDFMQDGADDLMKQHKYPTDENGVREREQVSMMRCLVSYYDRRNSSLNPHSATKASWGNLDQLYTLNTSKCCRYNWTDKQ